MESLRLLVFGKCWPVSVSLSLFLPSLSVDLAALTALPAVRHSPAHKDSHTNFAMATTSTVIYLNACVCMCVLRHCSRAAKALPLPQTSHSLNACVHMCVFYRHRSRAKQRHQIEVSRMVQMVNKIHRAAGSRLRPPHHSGTGADEGFGVQSMQQCRLMAE